MRAQSAPSEVATTEVAWQAPLQNSRPTFTHLEAGAGGMYGGGGLRTSGAIDSVVAVAFGVAVEGDVTGTAFAGI